MEGCLRQLSRCQDEVVEAPSIASDTDRFGAQKGPSDHPLCVGHRTSSIYSYTEPNDLCPTRL